MKTTPHALQAVSTALLAFSPRLQPWVGVSHGFQPVSTGLPKSRLQPLVAITASLCTLLFSLPALAQDPSKLAGIAAALDDRAKPMDSAILRHKLGQFWGAVIVSENGKTIFAKGYGLANDNLDPITTDSLFDIGSISKQFTAAAILKLESQGKLNIDDSVATYCPDVSERGHGVTLRHLLTHTSGMSDSVAIQRLDFNDRDAAVRLAIASKPNATPGERFEYCNAGYIVLAAVIEKVTGGRFEDYIRREIFKPANLKSTGFIDGIGLDPKKQTTRVISRNGHEKHATLFASSTAEPWAWGLKGAGGVATTLEDLVQWDEALRTEQVLTNEAKSKLYQVSKGGYAMGWFIESTPSGQKIQHGGATRGYRAQYTRYLDKHIVIAILTNEQNDPIAIEKLITKEILPESNDSITGELDLNHVPLTRYKSAVIEHGGTFKVQRDGNRVQLRAATKDDKPMAKVSMTPAAAKSLADRIRANINIDNATEPDIGISIASITYQANKDGIITLPDGLQWNVMPAYNGVGEGGQRITDQRTTVIVVDEENSFWPLFLKLNSPAAKSLADQFARAATELK